MRRPEVWAWLSLALIGVSLAVAFVALRSIMTAPFYAPVDARMQGLAAGAGLAAGLGAILALNAVIRARDAARLQAGEGVLARWRVSPSDWAAFLAVDASRAAATGLRNKLKIGDDARREGFDVLLGRDALLCDGACYTVRTTGLGNLLGGQLREMSWLDGSPVTLEWLRVYTGTDNYAKADVLRLPIPPGAIPQAEAALAVFQAATEPDRRAAARTRYLPG